MILAPKSIKVSLSKPLKPAWLSGFLVSIRPSNPFGHSLRHQGSKEKTSRMQAFTGLFFMTRKNMSMKRSGMRMFLAGREREA